MEGNDCCKETDSFEALVKGIQECRRNACWLREGGSVGGREVSLVITKLDEALHWCNSYQVETETSCVGGGCGVASEACA